MRKGIIMAIIIVCICCGCKKEEVKETKKVEVKKEESKCVALITDFESCDDKIYNGAMWQGIKKFAANNDYNKQKYNALVEDSDSARKSVIDKAVKGGADILVFADDSFEKVVYEAQKEYPDVDMLLVDFEPKSPKGEVEYERNVTSVTYKKEELGYLTGYVLIAEGYRKLGFYGGSKVDGSSAYGFGFIQGADAAAQRIGLAQGAVRMEYRYTNTNSASHDVATDAKKAYGNGTQVIFSCSGNIIYSIIDSCEKLSYRKIVSSVVDNVDESDRILFSAVVKMDKIVEESLSNYVFQGDKWGQSKAGQQVALGIKEDAVGLTAVESSWRLKRVTIKKYEAFSKKFASSNIVINKERLIPTSFVSVNMKEIK